MVFASSVCLLANFKMSLFLFFYFFVFYHLVVLQCVNIPHILNHPSDEGHLGCFQVVAIMNNAAMNIVEQICL